MKWYRYIYFVFILFYIIVPIILNLFIINNPQHSKSIGIFHFICLIFLIISGLMSWILYIYDEDTVLPVDKDESDKSKDNIWSRVYKSILIIILLILCYLFIISYLVNIVPINGFNNIYNPLSVLNIGIPYYADNQIMGLNIIGKMFIKIYKFFVILNNSITYAFFSGGIMLLIELISWPFLRNISAMFLLLFLYLTKINGINSLKSWSNESTFGKIIYLITTMGIDNNNFMLNNEYRGYWSKIVGTDPLAINWIYFMTSLYFIFWFPYTIVMNVINSTFGSFVISFIIIILFFVILKYVLYDWLLKDIFFNPIRI